MERILASIDQAAPDTATRRALRLAVYGVAEMAGNLSRWDRFYLKSYEAMAGHRFNFTTLAVEPNVWGTTASGRGSVTRRINAFVKAADWMHGRGIGRLDVEGPMASTAEPTPMDGHDVRVVEGDSRHIVLPTDSADVVLSDPPYHDDVQYGELSLPLRAWAGLSTDDLFGEASVNQSTQQNTAIGEYKDLLTGIFQECNRILRPGGHLIFSYANRDTGAWAAVIGALQDADDKAIGYTVLASENETDVVKRNVRACMLDFMIDVVPKKTANVEAWTPPELPPSAEGSFLAIIGETFMRLGNLEKSDLIAMRERLLKSDFLSAERTSQ
jgi:putative DNA methylase